jgi:hypothetical protein
VSSPERFVPLVLVDATEAVSVRPRPTGCDPRWINLSHLRFFLVRFYGLIESYLFLRRKFAVGVFLRVVLCNMSIKLL